MTCLAVTTDGEVDCGAGVARGEFWIRWRKEPVKPVGGMVTVPDRPGLGVEIDPAKVEEETLLSWHGLSNMTGSVQGRE